MPYHLQLCSQGLLSVQGEVSTLKKQNLALNDRCGSLEQRLNGLAEQLERKLAATSEQTSEKELASASSSEAVDTPNVEYLMKQQRVTDR